MPVYHYRLRIYGQQYNQEVVCLDYSSATLWIPTVAYRGNERNFGRKNDPMVGRRIGGVNVFGGGLALYGADGNRVGGVGVSGDTSCRDHMVAWETRNKLALDFVTSGVSGDVERPDNIIFDIDIGFGHPFCLDPVAEEAAALALTPVQQ